MNREELLADMETRMEPGFPPHIACDDGWIPLISDLYEKLLAIDPDFRIAQIKEKFGGLRFYASPSLSSENQDEFYAAIREAEVLSLRTCELTGKPGVTMVSDTGWIRTLDPAAAPSTYKLLKKENND